MTRVLRRRGVAGVAREMARGVAELCGLITSVSRSLWLMARTFVLVAREAPALVIATLLLALIAITYFGSQVCVFFQLKRYLTEIFKEY